MKVSCLEHVWKAANMYQVRWDQPVSQWFAVRSGDLGTVNVFIENLSPKLVWRLGGRLWRETRISHGADQGRPVEPFSVAWEMSVHMATLENGATIMNENRLIWFWIPLTIFLVASSQVATSQRCNLRSSVSFWRRNCVKHAPVARHGATRAIPAPEI